MINEKILFTITFDECYRVFKHKYKNTKRAILNLISKLLILPSFLILIFVLRAGYNIYNNQAIINKDIYIVFKVSIMLTLIWCVGIMIFNIFYTNSLAKEDTINYLNLIEKSKTGMVLKEEYVKLSYYNTYENVYYKGIRDIFLIDDIVVILIKPYKIFILPKRVFKNTESFKNFMSFLNSKIK